MARGRARDGGKLDDFEAFVARMLPDTPPPVPHLEVDNTGDLDRLRASVAALDLSPVVPG
jgi:hypothetical protein